MGEEYAKDELYYLFRGGNVEVTGHWLRKVERVID
jgi:hypothetical protein